MSDARQDFPQLLREYWASFEASIDELNAFVRPLALRNYQSQLLDRGTFSIVSPITGDVTDIIQRFMLRGNFVYYIPGPKKVGPPLEE